MKYAFRFQHLHLDGKNPRTSPGQRCSFIQIYSFDTESRVVSRSRFHCEFPLGPLTRAFDSFLVRSVTTSSKIRLHHRHCPPDLHSYFLKLVETPSQQRKKQSLSSRSPDRLRSVTATGNELVWRNSRSWK